MGDACAFAHGEHELVAKPITNYRTKKCRHFEEKGWCQYGPRCQFLHNVKSKEIKKIKISYGQLMQAVLDSYEISSNNGSDEDIGDFLSQRSNIEANKLPKLDVFKNIRG